MSDIRSQLVAALDSRLKSITVANGYETDLGLAVFPWLKFQYQGEPLICGYADPRRTAGNIGGEVPSLGEENFLLDIDLEAIASNDSEDLSISHAVIRDIRRAVGTDPTWGGLAERTLWNNDEIESAEGETITGFISISMQIFYVALDWTE